LKLEVRLQKLIPPQFNCYSFAFGANSSQDPVFGPYTIDRSAYNILISGYYKIDYAKVKKGDIIAFRAQSKNNPYPYPYSFIHALVVSRVLPTPEKSHRWLN
jgi:hypothetical protein